MCGLHCDITSRKTGNKIYDPIFRRYIYDICICINKKTFPSGLFFAPGSQSAPCWYYLQSSRTKDLVGHSAVLLPCLLSLAGRSAQHRKSTLSLSNSYQQPSLTHCRASGKQPVTWRLTILLHLHRIPLEKQEQKI